MSDATRVRALITGMEARLATARADMDADDWGDVAESLERIAELASEASTLADVIAYEVTS